MKNIPSFESNRKFYGDGYFPYGIDRSGEFTSHQASLLIHHGCAYKALAEGTRTAVTAEEEAFVSVCHGRQAPKTDHEKVWMLFSSKITTPKAVVSSPYAGKKSSSCAAPEISFNDDFE